MKILFPVEDDVLAGEQLEFLSEHNWEKPVSIYVVNVLHQSYQPSDEVLAEHRFAEELIKKVVRQLTKTFPKASITIGVAEGKAGDAILKIASDWKADLIVLASHGRKGVGQAILGSVAYEVLSKSPCRTIVLGTAARKLSDTKPVKESFEKLRFAESKD